MANDYLFLRCKGCKAMVKLYGYYDWTEMGSFDVRAFVDAHVDICYRAKKMEAGESIFNLGDNVVFEVENEETLSGEHKKIPEEIRKPVPWRSDPPIHPGYVKSYTARWAERDEKHRLEALKRKAERMFPVLGQVDAKEYARLGCPREVLWSFLEPHEAQAKANHDQTLERLAERGGLGAAEMVAIVEGKPWRDVRLMSVEQSVARLKGLLATFLMYKKPGVEGDLLLAAKYAYEALSISPSEISDTERRMAAWAALGPAIAAEERRLESLKKADKT